MDLGIVEIPERNSLTMTTFCQTRIVSDKSELKKESSSRVVEFGKFFRVLFWTWKKIRKPR